MYPSLEDMVVDQMMDAQTPIHQSSSNLPYPPQSSSSSLYPSAPPPTSASNGQSPVYPGLGEYMGLEFTEEVIRANMPEYLITPMPSNQVSSSNSTAGGNSGVIAPLSSTSPGFARSQLSHGVRQVVLCKDGEGRVGLRVKSIDKGIFVCLVTKGSPASMGGLRFGDQILQINGQNVAGFSENKVHEIFKRAGVNNIVLAVRDRPFERTLTLHKDSSGHLGFQFKDGKITSIAVDSSAARNGLLIDHNLLEVNGQNMVGVRDKEIGKVIDEAGQIVTVTVIPTYLYQHMMKNMSGSLVKKLMDHSIPDF